MTYNHELLKSTQSIHIKEILKFSDKTFCLDKEQYLFHEGLKAEGIFIILSGKVKISKFTLDV